MVPVCTLTGDNKQEVTRWLLGEDSTLAAHLRTIPEQRKKKGKQFQWWYLLLIMGWGLLCGKWYVIWPS